MDTNEIFNDLFVFSSNWSVESNLTQSLHLVETIDDLNHRSKTVVLVVECVNQMWVVDDKPIVPRYDYIICDDSC